MQAIYNLSAFVLNYSVSAEAEFRESLRTPTAILAGLLFFAAPIQEAGITFTTELQPIEDSHKDMSLAQVVDRFQDRLSSANKKDAYRLAKLVMQLSDRHMLSPSLILSVIETESSFRYNVVSKAGAVGLMQLRPSTAAEVAKKYSISSYKGAESLEDPMVNIRLGVAYLSYLRQRFGHSVHYLAAYNLGPTALAKRLREGNYELGAIENYVRKIQHHTDQIRSRRDAIQIGQETLPGLHREATLMAGL